MNKQTLATRQLGSLRAYAEQIVSDDRFQELLEAVDREMFERWREELDDDLRDQIRLEYLGFKLFVSKLKALSAHKLLRETEKP